MMKLKVEKIAQQYDEGSPFVLACTVSTDAPTEIAERIYVRSAFLTDASDSKKSYGFARRVLAAPKKTRMLLPGAPVEVIADPLETLGNEPLPSGASYVAEVTLQVHVKQGSGFDEVLLTASCDW